MEIVKSIDGTLLHEASHTFHRVTDNSAVPAPVISVNTGYMYMPIYTEKGPTNVLRTFAGTGAYDALIDTYGEPDVRRLGLPYTMAALHVKNGGGLVAQSIKHSSATKAGFILGLKIESTEEDGSEIKKTLGWILPDGSAFVEDPEASNKDAVPPTSAHTVHQISTKRISLVTIKVTGLTSLDTLIRTANKKFEDEMNKPSTDRERVFPILYGMYNGEGEYGNNFQFILNDSRSTIEGRPYFVGQFYDTRNTAYVKNTQRPFSLSKDYVNGSMPLNVNLVYNGDFIVRGIDSFNLDRLGELIYNEFDKVQLFPTTLSASTEAKIYTENVKAAKQVFGPSDKSTTRFNRMSYFNLATLQDLSLLFVTKKATTFSFSGGSEGLLTGMKEKGFDWDYTANIAAPGQPEKRQKIVSKMFEEAFLGQRSAEIYNLWSNDADYILDCGFPDIVKTAIVNFLNNRDDMIAWLNAPLSYSTIDEAIEWKKSNDYSSRNITYFPGNFEYLDQDSSESIRVPMTFAFMPNLIAHYTQRGFSESLAGVNNGMISLVTPGTGRAIGDLTLKSKDKLVRAGFVTVSAYAGERVFLDSQKSNYLLTQRSSLQQMHNNTIINRMIKTTYKVLEPIRHTLNSDENIKKIEDTVKLALAPYTNKVRSLSYQLGFKSDYDKAIGLLSHDIGVVCLDEIDYNAINFITQRG